MGLAKRCRPTAITVPGYRRKTFTPTFAAVYPTTVTDGRPDSMPIAPSTSREGMMSCIGGTAARDDHAREMPALRQHALRGQGAGRPSATRVRGSEARRSRRARRDAVFARRHFAGEDDWHEAPGCDPQPAPSARHPPVRELYAGRGAVERTFGRLKNEYCLTPLRTRGVAANPAAGVESRRQGRSRETRRPRHQRCSSPRQSHPRHRWCPPR